MKLNITKLQAGGYLPYQPLPMIPQGQAPAEEVEEEDTKEDKKDSNPYLDKTLVNKLLGQGITTDVIAYSEELESAYQQYSNMNEYQRNSYRGKQLRSILKGDLGQLNALMRGKKTLDESITNAKSNGALEEYAVTSSGMVVKNIADGKISTVSFADYAADNTGDKKYRALTNAQLAEEREYNKQLIGNSTVYSILNYGKGVEKVKEEVLKIAGIIGKTSNSVTNGAYSREDAENIKQLQAQAKQGSFKIKSGQSVETNAPQIEKAKMTMWLNLSDNSKNVLRARAAAMTNSPGQIEQIASNMAASLLDPNISTDNSIVYDESLKAGAKGSGSGGDDDKLLNVGLAERAFREAGDRIPLTQINDQGVKIEGSGYALPPSAYTGKDNERTPLQNAGGLNRISYLSKAFTMDGSAIDPTKTVITGEAYVAKLPVFTDENGNMVIDQDGAKKWALYEDALSKVPAAARDKDGRVSELKKSELRMKFNITNMNLKRVVVAEAQSFDTKKLWSNRDPKYFTRITGDEVDQLAKMVDPKNADTPGWGFIDNDAHKHLIFIPAKELPNFRDLDGNTGRAPESDYNYKTGFGKYTDNNTTYGQTVPPPPKFTADVWGVKI